MAYKFIINEDRLLMSSCIEYHFELVEQGTVTKGGGRWYMNEDEKKVWLYDTSMDYGQAKREDIEVALLNGEYNWSFEEYTFYHSYSDSLYVAFKDCVELKKN